MMASGSKVQCSRILEPIYRLSIPTARPRINIFCTLMGLNIVARNATPPQLLLPMWRRRRRRRRVGGCDGPGVQWRLQGMVRRWRCVVARMWYGDNATRSVVTTRRRAARLKKDDAASQRNLKPFFDYPCQCSISPPRLPIQKLRELFAHFSFFSFDDTAQYAPHSVCCAL